MAKNQITTVDIGTNSVKILQLEFSQTGIAIIKSGVKSYPRQSAVERIPEEVVLDTLSQLMREMVVQTKPVAIAVPRQFVTVKSMAGLPTSATNEDINRMVPLQIASELPFALTEAAYSIYNLQRSPEGVSLEVVAAKKASIQRYVDIAEETGLKLKAIIPSSFATYGVVFDQFKGELAGRTVAVADIGAGMTDICIIEHGRLSFSRSFTSGGNLLTQRFESEYGLSFFAAEERKINEANLQSDQAFGKGLNEIGNAEESFPAASAPVEENSPTRRWASDLATQIARSLRAFTGEDSINDIDELRLCGGGSLVPGLDSYLTKALGIEVSLWNPLQKIEEQSVQAFGKGLSEGGNTGESIPVEAGLQSGLSVALGLGIIGADGVKRTPTVNANMLPKEISEREQQTRRKIMAFIATAAAVLILAIGGLWVVSWQRSRVELRESLANEIKLLEQKVETRAAKTALESSILMQRMMAPYVTPLEILREMSSKLPDRKKIALTSFSIDRNGKVTMGVEANSHSDVSDMIRILNEVKLWDKAKLFDEVKYGAISRVTKEKRPILQVQIACTLNSNVMQEMSSSQ